MEDSGRVGDSEEWENEAIGGAQLIKLLFGWTLNPSLQLSSPRYREQNHALTFTEPVCIEHAHAISVVFVLVQKMGVLSALSILYIINTILLD